MKENLLDKEVTFFINSKKIKGVVWGIHPVKGYLKIVDENGGKYYKYPHQVELMQDTNSESNTEAQSELPKYDINQKFDYMSKMVDMVIRNIVPSVIITGEGGLGKTFLVNRQLEEHGLCVGDNYVVIKGFSTAKGLYRKLYEHSDELLVFDDCDEVLNNDVAKNILKSALDSYDIRIVSWVTNAIDDTLPNSFQFNGRIIFISNMSSSKIDGALLSRSLTIDLTMSTEDKIERMRGLVGKMSKHLDTDFKMDCIDLIDNNKDKIKNLNLRTLIKTIKIREAYPEDWVGMSEFMMLSGC